MNMKIKMYLIGLFIAIGLYIFINRLPESPRVDQHVYDLPTILIPAEVDTIEVIRR
jgi:hypothetical protein